MNDKNAITLTDDEYAVLGRVAMRFVDRAGDFDSIIDDAESICLDFAGEMNAVLDAALAQRLKVAALEDQIAVLWKEILDLENADLVPW